MSVRNTDIEERGAQMKRYDKYAVGDALRSLRTEKNLTQSQLAEKLELSTIHYSLIEQGQRKFSLEVLFRIMDVFDVDADRVLAIEPDHIHTDIFKEKMSALNLEEQKYVVDAWVMLVDGYMLQKERKAS